MTTNLASLATPAGAPHFHYEGSQLYAEGVALSELAKALGTPLYVYSRAALKTAWQHYAQATEGHHALVCFGMKANSNLAVLKEFARLGSGFDIVSGGELARVLAVGADQELERLVRQDLAHRDVNDVQREGRHASGELDSGSREGGDGDAHT